ncbi:MAG: hypothetical protein WKG00_04385 [Polyangiaceae bacterium]
MVRERAADLVCVVAEANAWPSRSLERSSVCPDELVRWTACRVATGESLDLVVAPRQPVAPATPAHIGLPLATLEGGLPRDVALARWSAFARETDVICEWGYYGSKLFTASGGWLPEARLDLREVARGLAGGKVGMLEEVAARLDADDQPAPGEGRAPCASACSRDRAPDGARRPGHAAGRLAGRSWPPSQETMNSLRGSAAAAHG